MYTLEDYNEAGRELEELLRLRAAPIALKLINRDEIPEGMSGPGGGGTHYALCQAFAAVRRNRVSMTMFREDHWCLWPLISLRSVGLQKGDDEYLGTKLFIKDAEAGVGFFNREFPMIAPGQEKDGLALAPLGECTFIPDAVVFYCDPAQLRQLIMAARFIDACVPGSTLQTVNSCGAAIIPVLNGELDYNLAIPDAGEFERSLARDDDMIFTISGQKLETVADAARGIDKMGFGYKQLAYDMNLEYPRAAFYNEMFEKWGLETGGQWEAGKR